MFSWSPFKKSSKSSKGSQSAPSSPATSSSSGNSGLVNSPSLLLVPPSSSSTEADINILFLTQTICPICSFVEDGKGLEKEHWKEGHIVKRKDDIWLVIKCQEHGNQEIKISSSFDFFMKTLDYSPDILESKPNFNPDIEELEKQIHNDGTIIENTPLMVDLDVYSEEQFIPDQHILHSIKETMKLIPKDKNVIIRVNGKLVEDMVTLNRKVNLILANVPKDNPIVLELSFDRVVQLSKLDDTCLLNPRIHPSVQIFLQKGIEKQTALELNNAFLILKQITNLTIIVRIVVSRPFPKLDSILNLLRFPMKGFCRFIIIEAERTPNQIMKQFKKCAVPFNEVDESFNVDPLELLKLIEEDTKGQIKLDDFFPASVGMILEPFLSVLGKGNYNIRPSPYCGFATCLINSENQQTYPSVPISRLLDIERLFKEMVPIVKNIKASSGSSSDIGFLQYMSLKKAVEKSKREHPEYPLPKDLFSYMISKDHTMIKKTRQIIDDLQFLVVHNVMDVGTLDINRRARCTLCRYQPDKGFISSCTNCI
ncbi:predicted protein [Naegleria gruberi]|uniref:Predicted protein n=1 Tax=Naegleria gruberi TaxID=5762 RepID=D2VEV5_NAEGR|nr:uncharacterized protein NAEGRDRAFT_33523 [Naegleria gruberi]EFC44668.1 predicted protein [Naegleria gruberi]|eukprot:XP_002677412.1 predicted protein [Naegleria gruberi strain NEG-M]